MLSRNLTNVGRNSQDILKRCVQIALIAAHGVLFSATATAGGFEIPDNGAQSVSRASAFTVKADDLTALAHNPGGLMRGKGLRVLYSHNVVHAPAKFTRAPTSLAHGDNPAGTDPNATVENQTPWFGLGGMFVAAHDFGLENWCFAVGFYGPSAAGHQEWPISGGQRYMLTKLDVIMVYGSAAIAYGVRDRFGLGLTLQVAYQPKTELTLVIDGQTGSDLSPYYASNDVEATIKLNAKPTLTAIAGGWLRLSDNWELGASGRILPIRMDGTGDIALQKTPTGAQFTPSQLAVTGSAARLQLILPPTAKIGLRYRGMEGSVERFDVEVNFVYEAWSMLKDYKVELDGKINLFAAVEAPDVTIAKRWKDTLSLRLGGTYNLAAMPLSLSAGAYYETGAVPNNYTNVDFMSFDRFGVGGGVRFAVASDVDVTLAYNHIFQADRTVTEEFGKVLQQRPISPCPQGCDGYDGVVANAGKFESSFDIISASAQIHF